MSDKKTKEHLLEDGRWVCALHTEALAGDPFGRDRHPAKPAV